MCTSAGPWAALLLGESWLSLSHSSHCGDAYVSQPVWWAGGVLEVMGMDAWRGCLSPAGSQELRQKRKPFSQGSQYHHPMEKLGTAQGYLSRGKWKPKSNLHQGTRPGMAAAS